ncbi:hypothetical protein [Devosia sp. SL43]|uniref:hypothetical protein n=1 Tax=Devosia sp. SL43 TaxID=2806348 RepID=UPI001F3731C7|nr:hypothetical protein [Devosia sp. SL43]UJW85290.1 hypothetical protein IM737_18105 [Devosia sp. SL43]
MRRIIAVTLFLLSVSAAASAYEVQRYTVYCADDRIEVSMWDLEQMKVRRGSDICQFASYTSYSSALTFADRNFGGEGEPCFC